jgi:ubiquitin-conjugating enzyme E2 R
LYYRSWADQSVPDFRFTRPLYHPNIYPDGRLCISILHPPGEDEMSGELASERWSPAQTVESVLISILSLLDDPCTHSPANIDASVAFRDDKKSYQERVALDLEVSRADVPANFVIPSHRDAFCRRPEENFNVEDWDDSDIDLLEDDDDEDDDDDVVPDFDSESDEESNSADADADADAQEGATNTGRTASAAGGAVRA